VVKVALGLDKILGLCKTWTLDWTGLWTGLDWTGLDWTDQNSCIETANTTKATIVCLQPCLKLLLRHHLLNLCEVKGHMHINFSKQE